MHEISNSIYRYYMDHLADLSFGYRFHYASRLYLWNQDKQALEQLQQLRSTFTANDDAAVALADVIRQTKESPPPIYANAANMRQPYFARYPDLVTYTPALFRTNFLETVYGLPARQAFMNQFDLDLLAARATQLRQDNEAIAFLSTHAVNFLYLYQTYVTQKSHDPADFLQIGRQYYQETNSDQLRLLIYLYTHCIIADTRFYYRPVPTAHIPIYRTMLAQLEARIDEHFDDIHLDNKFEFLVAAQLVGHTTKLSDRIWREAGKSFATDGDWLIDGATTGRTSHTDIDRSEHRNVLAIMASRSYQPLGH